MRVPASSLRVALACVLACALPGCSSPASKPALPPVTPIMIPPAMSAHDELVGGTWRWRGPDAGSPASRDAYTLEFLPDGRVVVRADCNRGSGRYATGANATLALSGIATTKVACPAGSLDAAFLHDLAAVERYRFDGDTLVLMLRGDARTLRFSR